MAPRQGRTNRKAEIRVGDILVNARLRATSTRAFAGLSRRKPFNRISR
jgi:hypothetical protein